MSSRWQWRNQWLLLIWRMNNIKKMVLQLVLGGDNGCCQVLCWGWRVPVTVLVMEEVPCEGGNSLAAIHDGIKSCYIVLLLSFVASGNATHDGGWWLVFIWILYFGGFYYSESSRVLTFLFFFFLFSFFVLRSFLLGCYYVWGV